MVRGTIVWVNLDPAVGAEVPKLRPAIVVSREAANRALPTLTIVPLSSVPGRERDRLVQPLLPRSDTRLRKESRALCDQVRTVDRRRIQSMGAILPEQALHKVNRGLVLHLGLD